VIDHIGMPVSDIPRATDFYMKALSPLGIAMIMQISAEQTGDGPAVGFGADGKPFFWLGEGEKAGGHVHVAFAAQSRADGDAVYQAARAPGPKDNGAPGLRPIYHANYYGAFVLDPDGNNIEAVCHAPA
jgi:catechol 2,3-dioxygenase-like lactoylglutathione lyase family enzyme